MTRFVPLTPELMGWAMALAGSELWARVNVSLSARIERMLSGAVAEAMLDGGRLIGAGGVTQHWPGRAEAWLLLAPETTKRERLAALHRCRDRIEELQQDGAFRRIEMYVAADAPWCKRLGAVLGFTLEGTARAWDPLGNDYCLFARVAGAA